MEQYAGQITAKCSEKSLKKKILEGSMSVYNYKNNVKKVYIYSVKKHVLQRLRLQNHCHTDKKKSYSCTVRL